jgi:hypothetical protein
MPSQEYGKHDTKFNSDTLKTRVSITDYKRSKRAKQRDAAVSNCRKLFPAPELESKEGALYWRSQRSRKLQKCHFKNGSL